MALISFIKGIFQSPVLSNFTATFFIFKFEKRFSLKVCSDHIGTFGVYIMIEDVMAIPFEILRGYFYFSLPLNGFPIF